MVARSLLDTLRSIGDCEEDCHTVLKSMVRMSEDGGRQLLFSFFLLTNSVVGLLCHLYAVLKSLGRFAQCYCMHCLGRGWPNYWLWFTRHIV